MTPEEKKRDAILLPQHQIFRLMHPKKEDGESFPGFTIRDECQNEYPHIMNKFRDRRGPGAKYAILGDIYDQISRPGLDEYWNGLLLNLSKNMGLEHVACITLTEKWSDRQLK
jgi:predicted ribonuclease YlaK